MLSWFCSQTVCETNLRYFFCYSEQNFTWSNKDAFILRENLFFICVFLWIIRCIVRSVRSIGDIFLRMTYEKLLNNLFISQKMDFRSIFFQNCPFDNNLFSLTFRTVFLSSAQTRLCKLCILKLLRIINILKISGI